MRIILAAALSVAIVGVALAQVQHLPRGVATDIANAEIMAAARKNPGAPVSDIQLRVLSINNEYNVAVGVVQRAKTVRQSVGGSEHSQITEIYHVISGSGTLLTGGSLAAPEERDPNHEAVRNLTGPSTQGKEILNGTSRTIKAGDVVVIPPNTPHTFTEITEELAYLVVRMDPKKVLPAGYVGK